MKRGVSFALRCRRATPHGTACLRCRWRSQQGACCSRNVHCIKAFSCVDIMPCVVLPRCRRVASHGTACRRGSRRTRPGACCNPGSAAQFAWAPTQRSAAGRYRHVHSVSHRLMLPWLQHANMLCVFLYQSHDAQGRRISAAACCFTVQNCGRTNLCVHTGKACYCFQPTGTEVLQQLRLSSPERPSPLPTSS